MKSKNEKFYEQPIIIAVMSFMTETRVSDSFFDDDVFFCMKHFFICKGNYKAIFFFKSFRLLFYPEFLFI